MALPTASGRPGPDFLIVGAAKAGTTALYYHLQGHPSIYLADVKEPRFLCSGERTEADREAYLDLFAKARPEQVVGEASTWYLYFADRCARAAAELYGPELTKLRIVAVLRNPIHRAWSHYSMKRRNGVEDLPFLEAIDDEVVQRRLNEGKVPTYDYLGFGRYVQQLRAFRDVFPHVHVMLHDDLEAQPHVQVHELLAFLGVAGDHSLQLDARYNVSGSPRGLVGQALDRLLFKPASWRRSFRWLMPSEATRRRVRAIVSARIYERQRVPPEIHAVLRDVYRAEIEELEKVLDRRLDHWLV